MVGQWCAGTGELLHLHDDGGFTIERLSKRYVNEILHDDAYIEGYRLMREFNNVVPRNGAGEWSRRDVSHDRFSTDWGGIDLTFAKLGDRDTVEYSELFYFLDDGETTLALNRSGEYEQMFVNCSGVV